MTRRKFLDVFVSGREVMDFKNLPGCNAKKEAIYVAGLRTGDFFRIVNGKLPSAKVTAEWISREGQATSEEFGAFMAIQNKAYGPRPTLKKKDVPNLKEFVSDLRKSRGQGHWKVRFEKSE